MYRLLCEDIFPKALGSARVYTHISTFGSITEDWACCTSTNTHVHICCVCTTKIDVHLITYAEFFLLPFLTTANPSMVSVWGPAQPHFVHTSTHFLLNLLFGDCLKCLGSALLGIGIAIVVYRERLCTQYKRTEFGWIHTNT